MHCVLAFRTSLAAAALAALAGCGGTTDGSGTTQPTPAPTGGTTVGTAPGTTPTTPGTAPTPPTVATTGLLFPDALDVTQAERAGMFDFARAIVPTFEAANRQPLALPPPGSAEFMGAMLARMGTGEEFIHGSLDIRVNFDTGNGNGTFGFIAVSGADIDNRLLDSADFLDVVVTGATDQTFGGTITGTVDESIGNPFPVNDSFTLDSTIDGRFVGTGSIPSIVGTVSGTVTSNAGTRPLEGVIVTERGLAPIF